MKIKKIVSILVMQALLYGCASAESYTAGMYEAAVRGFGGEVKAVVTFDAEKITDVALSGENETPSIGGAALETVKEQILAAQSTEIDGVAGATVTTNAVKDAVNACIAEATGAVAEEKVAADGVYTGSAFGFMSEIKVEVTMKDNAIADVKVVENDDTGMIGVAAGHKLAKNIVEHQSLAVDAIAGATVSSNGVFAAVTQALEAAGADVAALKAAPVELRAAQTIEMDTQIVVIGAGMAGMNAALEAADQGAEVIVLEKQGIFGGSVSRSEGFVMGTETDFQKSLGINDSLEDMYNDIMELYADEPVLDTTLLRKTLAESNELIDFLTKHGVIFEDVVAISAIEPRNDRRSHASWKKGDGLMEKLVESAQNMDNITILLDTPATELIKENGAVVGVKATNQYGDDITIRADAAILCAGSYGGNVEMVKELHSNINPVSFGGCGSGDGYTMAEKAGAKMISVGYMSGEYSYVSGSSVDYSIARPGASVNASFDVIQVNTKGERLINEDAFTFDFGDLIYDSGASFGWAIGGKIYDSQNPHLYQSGKDVQYTADGKTYNKSYQADTVEELAMLTGMDAATLKDTIDRYNASCDAGIDEEFGKDPKYMVRVDAPYTAYMLMPAVADGYDGCAINENAQVLDTEGNVIPGFYAAGSCAKAQLAGNRYYGCGTDLMVCGVFGRAAGNHAANMLK